MKECVKLTRTRSSGEASCSLMSSRICLLMAKSRTHSTDPYASHKAGENDRVMDSWK